MHGDPGDAVHNGPGFIMSGLQPNSTRRGEVRFSIDAFSSDDPFDPRRAEARSFGGEGGIVSVSPYGDSAIPRAYALGTAVCFATASCAALTPLAPLVEPAGSHPPLLPNENGRAARFHLAERAGFEPVSETGFPLKRGAKSAPEAAQIRLFATRFATIAKAGIEG